MTVLRNNLFLHNAVEQRGGTYTYVSGVLFKFIHINSPCNGIGFSLRINQEF